MSQRTRVPSPANRKPAPPHSKRHKPIIDQRRTPWGLIAVVSAVVVIAAGVAIVVTSSNKKSSTSGGSSEVMPAAVTGATTHEVAPQTATDSSGIAGVLAWNTTGWPGDGGSSAGALQHDHVAGPVTYTETPPVGGPHSATWLNAGIYDRPVPSERAVHNMEHGAVWITYSPGLTSDQVQALRSFALKQSKLREQTQSGPSTTRYLVMSPWASSELPAPIVISAWGHQLRVTSVDDPRLQRFVDTFRSSRAYTPELGEPVDGVPVGVGGQPLIS